MAYKDPPREKYHNGAPCSVILLVALVVGTGITALIGTTTGWWA